MGIRGIEALTMTEKWHLAIFRNEGDKYMAPACGEGTAHSGDGGQTEDRDKVTCTECILMIKAGE